MCSQHPYSAPLGQYDYNNLAVQLLFHANGLVVPGNTSDHWLNISLSVWNCSCLEFPSEVSEITNSEPIITSIISQFIKVKLNISKLVTLEEDSRTSVFISHCQACFDRFFLLNRLSTAFTWHEKRVAIFVIQQRYKRLKHYLFFILSYLLYHFISSFYVVILFILIFFYPRTRSCKSCEQLCSHYSVSVVNVKVTTSAHWGAERGPE